eukprot:10924462-Karenia_brevis.AAC.1
MYSVHGYAQVHSLRASTASPPGNQHVLWRELQAGSLGQRWPGLSPAGPEGPGGPGGPMPIG